MQTDTWSWFLSHIQQTDGITPEEFCEMREDSRNALFDQIVATQAIQFMSENPEYAATERNFHSLLGICNSLDIPASANNLSAVFKNYPDMFEQREADTCPPLAVISEAKRRSC